MSLEMNIKIFLKDSMLSFDSSMTKAVHIQDPVNWNTQSIIVPANFVASISDCWIAR